MFISCFTMVPSQVPFLYCVILVQYFHLIHLWHRFCVDIWCWNWCRENRILSMCCFSGYVVDALGENWTSEKILVLRSEEVAKTSSWGHPKNFWSLCSVAQEGKERGKIMNWDNGLFWGGSFVAEVKTIELEVTAKRREKSMMKINIACNYIHDMYFINL